MDRNQAEAVAQAILEPHRKAEDELRLKRERDAARLKDQRVAAWAAVAGCVIGAFASYALGERVAYGVIVGFVVGGSLGWALRRSLGLRT